MNDKTIATISIGDLFHSGTYVIPIYQRNYAWQEAEVKQLIQDIYDFSKSHSEKNYFIGTLVVYKRFEEGKEIFETIDGQQRLTTINILYAVLHREFEDKITSKINYELNLKFDARKISTYSLDYISKIENPVTFDTGEVYNSNIQDAYEVAKKMLNNLFKSNSIELQKFYKYLSNNVRILRVTVPKDTDLNHYFEIMNTRGEQLEKHEILKASLMQVLSDDKKASNAFNKVWEACSDMERYVQYGFSTNERDRVFSDNNWNQLNIQSFDELALYLDFKEDSKNTRILNLKKIVSHQGNFEHNPDEKEDAPERFSSIINFPNFLLHILRVQTISDISLDDKRLLEPFNKRLDELKSNEEKSSFVKQFAFNLLKGKHLFDQFIIKREFLKEKDGWSLKSLKWYEGNKVSYVNSFQDEGLNRRILMLLSMFHISAPTLIYKNWLNAVLYFLFKNETVSPNEYLEYLENLAQAFLYDRYIASAGNEIDYFEMVYDNNGKAQNRTVQENQNWKNLNTGTSVENFIFNYLDYILWLSKSEGYDQFEFSFRSSVEHYYPQNPISSDDKLDQDVLDLFGNLCLISRSKNSTLGRYMPQAKKDHYVRVKPDSLKQKLMMKEEEWEKKEIEEHTERMIQKLKDYSYAI